MFLWQWGRTRACFSALLLASAHRFASGLLCIVLPSLELRRLYADLVWYYYKILFGIVDVQSDKFFEFNMRPSRGIAVCHV